MIDLQTLSIMDSGIREPGGNSYKSFFNINSPEGYRLQFDPETGLVHVSRGATTRTFHVTRMKECELAHVAPAKGKP
jgi:hypothetical protein